MERPFGNTISLFFYRRNVQVLRSQSLSFTSTAAYRLGNPRRRAGTTVALPHPTVWRCTRRFISPGLSFQSTGSYPAIAASTTSGRGVERPAFRHAARSIITCFKWYFLKIEGMFRAPLVFGQDSLCTRIAASGTRMLSACRLSFSIHQQRGPELQAKIALNRRRSHFQPAFTRQAQPLLRRWRWSRSQSPAAASADGEEISTSPAPAAPGPSIRLRQISDRWCAASCPAQSPAAPPKLSWQG